MHNGITVINLIAPILVISSSVFPVFKMIFCLLFYLWKKGRSPFRRNLNYGKAEFFIKTQKVKVLQYSHIKMNKL